MTDPKISRLITADPGLPRPTPSPAYWQHIPHALANTQSPSLPNHTDIAIIGSGITGLAVAHTLLESHPTITVTVLEARTLCSGATGRNGGQLATNVGEEYLHLVRTHGAVKAGQICRFTLRNLASMKHLANTYAPNTSQLQELQKLRVFQTPDSFAQFNESIQALERDHPDLSGVYTVLTREQLKAKYNTPGAGAALLPAGTLWPYRLVTAVFAHLKGKYGSRLAIETHTPVTRITHDPIPNTDNSTTGTTTHKLYTLHTPRGVLHAAQIAHCTNGYAGHLLPALRGPIHPFKGTMTVQDPGTSTGFPNQGRDLSWGFHYPGGYNPAKDRFAGGLYYLLQNRETGYFFFGGEETRLEDCLSADDSAVEKGSVAQLREKLPRFLGAGGTTRNKGQSKDQSTDQGQGEWPLVAAWSGVMGFSGDGLPLVGRLGASLTGRNGEGEYIAAAFNGYGMANCLLCGEALAKMMLGKEEEEGLLPDSYRIDEDRMNKLLTVGNAVKYFSKL